MLDDVMLALEIDPVVSVVGSIVVLDNIMSVLEIDSVVSFVGSLSPGCK